MTSIIGFVIIILVYSIFYGGFMKKKKIKKVSKKEMKKVKGGVDLVEKFMKKAGMEQEDGTYVAVNLEKGGKFGVGLKFRW